jgi:hypothetical protein
MKRGRPFGFKLSEASKRAISESKRGQRHKQETRDKISKSLTIYFKKLNPFSDEILNTYDREGDNTEVKDWVYNVKDDLDNLDDVMTSKGMHNSRKIEITCSSNIEYYHHNMTPELLMMFKEHCEELNIDADKVYDLL